MVQYYKGYTNIVDVFDSLSPTQLIDLFYNIQVLISSVNNNSCFYLQLNNYQISALATVFTGLSFVVIAHDYRLNAKPGFISMWKTWEISRYLFCLIDVEMVLYTRLIRCMSKCHGFTQLCRSKVYSYVTGFWKLTELSLGLFHFISSANGYTCTLHMHSAITRLG